MSSEYLTADRLTVLILRPAHLLSLCVPMRFRFRISTLLLATLVMAFVTIGTQILWFRMTPVDWQPMQNSEIQRALDDGQVVVVHFVADWSIASQLSEKGTFEMPAIKRLVSGRDVVAFRADATRSMPILPSSLQQAGKITVPMVVILRPDARQKPVFLEGELSSDDIEQAITDALQSQQSSDSAN